MSQVVVITGLADGMGRHVAKMLAGKGHSIAGFDMDAKGIDSLKKELKKISGNDAKHHLVALDITNRKGILKFRDEVLKKYDRVDTVLSNVGIGFFGPFEEVDLEKALKCLEINVIGAMAIFQAFIPSMRERREGKLIAMSSIVGQVPFPFESIYTASKFGIEGWIQALKYELDPFGIKFAVISPAQVSTTFAAKIHKLPPKDSPYRDRVKRFIDKDNEMIKDAPTPEFAAKVIVKVLEKKKPKLFNQIEFQSKVFYWLNKLSPRWFRDFLVLTIMDIRK